MFIRKYVLMESADNGGATGGNSPSSDLEKKLAEMQTNFETQQTEIERLRTHSQKLLDEKKQLQKQYKDFEQLGDAETIQNMIKQFNNDENARLFAEGKGPDVLKKHTERLQLDFETKLKEMTDELGKTKDDGKKYQKLYHESEAGHALRAAAVAAGVRNEAVDDILLRGRGLFAVADDRTLEARDSEGNLKLYKNKALTPELFIESLREQHPHYWPDSQSGGARGGAGGGRSVSNPFMKGSKDYNVTAQAKLRKTDPQLANELAAEAEAAAKS